jgi:hypothetical protein
MVLHDRSRVILRCMRCGGWFSVPPGRQLLAFCRPDEGDRRFNETTGIAPSLCQPGADLYL